MKTASLSAAAALLLPAHSIAQSVRTASGRALQDEAPMSLAMDGVEYMGHDGSHSGKSGKVAGGKSGKAEAPHLPSVFNQTDQGAYRQMLFNPNDPFPTGEKFDLFVIDPDGETIGSQRGYSFFYPPYTEGNFIGNRVYTVMGETVTIVGENDIVAATEGYSEYVGGKVYISTIQFQPFYLGTVTLALPGTPAPPTPAPVTPAPTPAPVTPAPTPAPTPVPKAFESLPELSTAVRDYMAQGCGLSAGCEVGLTYGHPMNTWDVSMVNNFFQLFLGMDSFNEDISDWNTSAVTNMLNCFQRNSAFNGDLSKWDVSKNTDFRSTFSAASSFNSDISMWNTSSGRFFSATFIAAESFNVDISGWDMSNALDAAHMFDHAVSFNQDISAWNTAGMTATRAMFFHAREFNQDVSSWDLSNVHDIAYMFEGAEKFNQNLCAWDSTFPYNEPFFNIFNDSGCEHTDEPDEDMQGPFCTACGDRRVLRKNPLVEQEKPSLSQKHAQAAAAAHRSLQGDCFADKAELETAITSYFDEDCPNNASCETGVQYGWPMNVWCVGSVDNMQSLFEGMRTFNEDISAWDVSSVTTTRRMFHNARAFNGNLSSWNTSSNTDMWEMFYNAMAFEGGDLTGWDVSNVRFLYHCFWYARVFNGDISTWDISSIKNGAPSVGLNGAFFGAPEFNADMSGWDLTGANQLIFAFFHNSKFNSNISGWNVSASDYNRGMFYRATSFNQDLSSWRTTDAYDNLYMFEGASSFNQDLCAWGDDADYVYPASFDMFRSTGCEETGTPTEDDLGPFCAQCSN